MKNEKFNLIFDFDGTLVDSFDVAMEKLAALAKAFNFREIEVEDKAVIKNLTSKEIIKYLKIPFYKLPQVLHQAREHMRNEIPHLATFIDLPEVLTELWHLGFSMGILTSNSFENVTIWLDRYKIRHLFKFIHAESSYFGKKHLLKKVMKSQGMGLSQTFYIGDETRDIEAAKDCCIRSIAVSWGFNSEEVLVRQEPSYLARKPNDLLVIMREQGRLST